ncbi:GCN5-related N-acetyltransferase [Hymenopellis radicata]|nr:GCN5-related N-acetyltransferase [Hymenopellis radicata]
MSGMERSTTCPLPADVSCKRIGVEDTIPLRHSVLWPNEEMSRVQLPEDETGYHFGAFVPAQGDPVAVISLFREMVPGEETIDNAARFRKFACDPLCQGRGIGTLLLQEVFRFAFTELGARVIWCDARASAAGWYERRGMQKFGQPFFKGAVEYVRMKGRADELAV